MSFEGPVVLIHAFPLNASLWQPQVDRAPAGVRFLTPNFPGFNGSVDPPARSMDDIARSVLRERIGITPACGLAGATPRWARTAIELAQKAADAFGEDPDAI